jgi:Mrp family chromosome partitioning ATPase/capsular polysaccharide biosynthesis protein
VVASGPTLSAAGEQGAHIAYLRALRAHPILVVAAAVVAVGAAIAIAKTRTPSYEATAQILVTPVAGNVQTATSLLKTPAAAAASANALGGGTTTHEVQQAISIQPVGESNVLAVVGKSSNPNKAAEVANAYAHAALSQHIALLSREASSEIAQLQARERALKATEPGQLAGELAALSAVAAGRDPNFSLLQRATPPTSPSGTSTKLIALLGLLAGLVIGVGAAIGIDFLNLRIRDEEEVLLIYPLPVLSRIPDLPRSLRAVATSALMPPGVREAFRSLQVQLVRDDPVAAGATVIALTSASTRDGKTTSAVELSMVLAAAGHRTILIDFDLRKPEIARRLGVRPAPRDYAYSDCPLAELLVSVPVSDQLCVVGAHPQQDLTALEAAGRRLPALIEEARQACDFVVIDTPPVGRVSDALRALSVADRSVLVARLRNTDRDELTQTRDLLERLGLTPDGLLLIGVAERAGTYGAYGDEKGKRAGASANGATDVRVSSDAAAPPRLRAPQGSRTRDG